MNKKIILGIVIIVVVIIGGWYIGLRKVEAPANIESDSISDVSSSDENPGARIKLGENQSAVFAPTQAPGTEVVARVFQITKDGFVVIHEMQNGAPGKVIGSSSLLEKGIHDRVVVTLDSPTKDGDTLMIMLYADNGDGTFNVTQDLPLKNIDDIVISTFEVREGADPDEPIAI